MPHIINIKRIFAAITLLAFMTNGLLMPAYAQGVSELPVPGTMVNVSPAFEPVLIKGIKVHPQNPFLFDFIIDTGNSLQTNQETLQQESQRLIKYFLTSLTIPEKDLWVNLSPYEKDRLIAPNLGETEMGRDMLAQDYILKQLTASLIYPEKSLGKDFWNKVYAKAQALYGTTDIPVNTFNKVWIVADKADVFERSNTAYVIGAHLKVMLEEDYLSRKQHNVAAQHAGPVQDTTHTLASQIVREIVLPEIEKEVNTGKNFAPLRQMYYSMILATWYKDALKEALLTQIYGNQNKVTIGINASDPTEKEQIFKRYLEAYKKGVFNYIKDDIDSTTKEPIAKKYFSGGLEINVDAAMRVFHDQLPPGEEPESTGNTFDVTAFVNPVEGNEQDRIWALRKNAFLNDRNLKQLPPEVLKIAEAYFDNIHQLSKTTPSWNYLTAATQRKALIKSIKTIVSDKVEAYLKFNNLVLYMPVKPEVQKVEKDAFLKTDWESDQAMIGEVEFHQIRDRSLYRFGWVKKLTPEEARDQTKKVMSLKSIDKTIFSPSEVFDVFFRLSAGDANEGSAIYDIYVRPQESRSLASINEQNFYKGFIKLTFKNQKLVFWDEPDISPSRQDVFPWLKDFLYEKLKSIEHLSFAGEVISQRDDFAMISNHRKDPQIFAIRSVKKALRLLSNMEVRMVAAKTILKKPKLFSKRDLALAKEAVNQAIRYPNYTVDEARLTAIEIILDQNQNPDFKSLVPSAIKNLKDMFIKPQSRPINLRAAFLMLKYRNIEDLGNYTTLAQNNILQRLGREDLDGLEAARATLLSNDSIFNTHRMDAWLAMDNYLSASKETKYLTGPNLLWILTVLDVAVLKWDEWSLSKQITQKEWLSNLVDALFFNKDKPRIDPFLRANGSNIILTYANDMAMMGFEDEPGDITEFLAGERLRVYEAINSLTFGSPFVEITSQQIHDIALENGLKEAQVTEVMEHTLGMHKSEDGTWSGFNVNHLDDQFNGREDESDFSMNSDQSNKQYAFDRIGETLRELQRLKENLKIVEDQLRSAPSDPKLLAQKEEINKDIATMEEKGRRLGKVLGDHDQAMNSSNSDRSLVLFNAPASSNQLAILEPEIESEAGIPVLDIQFKYAPQESPITHYVSADPMFGGGFPNKIAFNQYSSALQSVNIPQTKEIMTKFFQSKYGHRLRKALGKLGIQSITVDLIPPETWDDYDYAFAVRHIIHEQNSLYVAVNAGMASNPISGIVAMISGITSTSWGKDVLSSEGLVLKNEEDPLPTITKPSLPPYFVLIQILKQVNILPETASERLEREAFPYQNQLHQMLTEKAPSNDIHQLAQLLWEQLPEEGGSLPGAIYMRDKKTYTEIDISANDEKPDFRLKDTDIRSYIRQLRKPGAFRLHYTHRVNRNSPSNPFIDIDINQLFGDQINKLLDLRVKDDEALKQRVDQVERKVMGLHELISRLITRSAEYEILTFEGGASFKTNNPQAVLQTPPQLEAPRDEAMTGKKEMRNGGYATEQEVVTVQQILSQILAIDKQEHGFYTPLLEEVYQMAKRPAYAPSPWNEEKLAKVTGFDNLLKFQNRDIVLSSIYGDMLERAIGPVFKGEQYQQKEVPLVKASSFVDSRLKRALGDENFIAQLELHAQKYFATASDLKNVKGNASAAPYLERLDQLDNDETALVKTAIRKFRIQIEFNKEALKWNLVDNAMGTDFTKGGIDLNREQMQMNVQKEGKGVQMQFDPAILERIKKEGFEGLEFKIQSIQPVSNLSHFLGIEKSL